MLFLVSNDAKVLFYEDLNVTSIPSTTITPTNEFLRSFIEGVYSSFKGYVIYKYNGVQVIAYSDNNFLVNQELNLFSVNFSLSQSNGYTLQTRTFDDVEFSSLAAQVTTSTAEHLASNGAVINGGNSNASNEFGAYIEFSLPEADPVDAFEINRNNVIYGYQHNRNPFVDHPELVNMIYS